MKTTEPTLEEFGLQFKSRVGAGAGSDVHANRRIKLNKSFSYITFGPCYYGDKAENDSLPFASQVRNVIDRIKGRRFHDGQHLCCSLTCDPYRTTEENVVHDVATAYSLIYDFVDMVEVDTSVCPNGSKSPLLCAPDLLFEVLDSLLGIRVCYDVSKPLVLNISPDFPKDSLDSVLSYCMLNGVDGVSLNSVESVKYASELSKGRYPIIGTVNDCNLQEGLEMLKNGAELISIVPGKKKISRCSAKRFLNLLDND